MIQYIDAHHALSHAYAILARGESLEGTLANRPPGGDLSTQEWVTHACYVVMGMEYIADGPYRRAIEARMSHDNEEKERAVALLAPRIECPSRSFNYYTLTRWAWNKNDKQDWDYWVGITHKSRRTLERWQGDIRKQAKRFLDLGLNMTTDHFRATGICESEAA